MPLVKQGALGESHNSSPRYHLRDASLSDPTMQTPTSPQPPGSLGLLGKQKPLPRMAQPPGQAVGPIAPILLTIDRTHTTRFEAPTVACRRRGASIMTAARPSVARFGGNWGVMDAGSASFTAFMWHKKRGCRVPVRLSWVCMCVHGGFCLSKTLHICHMYASHYVLVHGIRRKSLHVTCATARMHTTQASGHEPTGSSLGDDPGLAIVLGLLLLVDCLISG
ncbi:hypothetical protein B0I35DRAFT_231054 [Stachybotrys elegans]|uniref:Uncharacterized protein n=1 Tax=Stachybotrys elegans TaxID=80388 RepID=A0A8K0WRQ0_9HYPO|nr:hypothetical protein B0I35DRAFT_231054 [Stachybotrys elegans]